MTTSWTPPVLVSSPSLETSTENLVPPPPPFDLSPLSSAQIHEQHRPHHHHHHPFLSSSHSNIKLFKHPYRHSRSHRYHYHHTSSINKRKRPSAVESNTGIKEESNIPSTEESLAVTSLEHNITHEEIDDKKPIALLEEMFVTVSKASIDENSEVNVLTTVKESSEMNDTIDESASSNNNNILSSSSKINRDLLRKNISQHVHTTLKPYTKRTCKQGRIVSTDDIKYLVKKFTLAVLDKEIEKARNEAIPLSPVLTDRVRLKTEVYVKKYMNKMGPVFQRHDTTVHSTALPTTDPQASTTATNSE